MKRIFCDHVIRAQHGCVSGHVMDQSNEWHESLVKDNLCTVFWWKLKLVIWNDTW